MAAFDGTNTHKVGDKVDLITESELIDGTIVAVSARDYGEGMMPTGYYAVKCDDGVTRTYHHSELELERDLLSDPLRDAC